MCPVSDLDASKIAKHKEIVADPEVRQALFKQFTPTFFFHSSEDNFPVDPDTALRNIIEVKRDEYLNIKQRHNRELTPKEKKELNLINRFFWNEEANTFDVNFKRHQNDPEFIALSARDEHGETGFLIFDEKHYGYKVGEKIDVIGIAPKGHSKYASNKENAPIATTIVPTKNGFYIQYQYVYALNHAINGFQWLRRLLPESWCRKLSDFGFHYGDCEGVGIHITYDEASSKAQFQSMQTFAHGRKGARRVGVEDCSFDENGKVCVFVGAGGHPSYADNFVGRNIFMDIVGDAYRLDPSRFIDVSEDVLHIALDSTKGVHSKHLAATYPNLAKDALTMPGTLSGFSRFADSNPLAYDGEKTQEEIRRLSETHNNYKPFLLFTKLWQAFTRFISSIINRVKPEEVIIHKPLAPILLVQQKKGGGQLIPPHPSVSATTLFSPKPENTSDMPENLDSTPRTEDFSGRLH